MSKTVFITGASSGIGRSIAQLFLRQGWNVAATMRRPEEERQLTGGNLKLFKLDVTDTDSIQDAVREAVAHFGKIDVVVNNAGYGSVGIFEAFTSEQIRRQFETNVFGLMNVTAAILPHFRSNRSGIIINIASIGGKVTFPLYSLYHSSKWAVEGFSESLHFELRTLGIRVKIIEPGVIKTDFYSRSQDMAGAEKLTDYRDYLQTVLHNTQSFGAKGESPDVVASTIYKAATDGSGRLRYPVGDPAPWLLPLRKILPESWFFALVRRNLEKGLNT